MCASIRDRAAACRDNLRKLFIKSWCEVWISMLSFIFCLCYQYESFFITKSYHLGGLFVNIRLNSLQALTQQKEVGFCNSHLASYCFSDLLIPTINIAFAYFIITLFYRNTQWVLTNHGRNLSHLILFILSLTLGL